jgi:hypothetical protein
MKRIKVMIPGDNLVRQDLGGEQSKEITAALYYDDGKVVHACDGGIILPGIRLVWTKSVFVNAPLKRVQWRRNLRTLA